MLRCRPRLAAAIEVLVHVARPARLASGQQAYLTLYADAAGTRCAFDHVAPSGVILDAYVFIEKSLGVTQTTFGLPSTMTTSAGQLALIGFESPHATATLPDGSFRVTTASCLDGSAPRYLGRAIFLFVTGPSGTLCTPVPVEARPLTPMTFVDGSGVTRPAGGMSVDPYSCCAPLPTPLAPWDPVPPDGATGVPTRAVLRWSHELADGPDPTAGMSIRLAGGGIDTTTTWPGALVSSFTTPPLQPNTTYTWTVRQWFNGLAEGSGVGTSTWTFTTGDLVVPARATTWGRLKALYSTR